MKAVRWLILPLALALLAPFLAGTAPQEKAERKQEPKEQKVRKLLEVTGAEAQGKQVLDAMLGQFQKMPDLPEGFIEKFKELSRSKNLSDIVIPIYLKHLDEDALDGVLAFYQTEAGKKFLKAQPAIMKESMEVGQKWGQDLAMKTLKALQDDKKKDQ